MKNEKTAKRLATALSNNNMTAAELSRRAGVNESSVSHYLNGLHAPSNITAGKMGNVLGVSPVWLMGFDVPMVEKVTLELEGFTPKQIEMIKAYAEFIRNRGTEED